MDKLTTERRSVNMSRIRSKDTAAELLLRQLLYRCGYRFRLHRRVCRESRICFSPAGAK